jgi:hypothetical protein
MVIMKHAGSAEVDVWIINRLSRLSIRELSLYSYLHIFHFIMIAIGVAVVHYQAHFRDCETITNAPERTSGHTQCYLQPARLIPHAKIRAPLLRSFLWRSPTV